MDKKLEFLNYGLVLLKSQRIIASLECIWIGSENNLSTKHEDLDRFTICFSYRNVNPLSWVFKSKEERDEVFSELMGGLSQK